MQCHLTLCKSNTMEHILCRTEKKCTETIDKRIPSQLLMQSSIKSTPARNLQASVSMRSSICPLAGKLISKRLKKIKPNHQ